MEKVKKYFTMMLTFFMILGLISLPMGIYAKDKSLSGSGTKEDPYLINDAASLMTMSELVNSDASYKDDYYKMTKDIDLKGVAFTPIGNNTNKFSGHFDGDGYVIDNLNINSTTEPTGLFGFVERGTIVNVGIESGNVTGDIRVGGLVGRTMYATIVNCYSKANVNGTNDVGGLVGMFNNSDLYNSFSWGKVVGKGVSVGGLLGGANRSIDPAYPSTIENCYSLAEVSGGSNVGVLLGYDESTHGYITTYKNLYYKEGSTLPAIGNNTISETFAVGKENLTNGVFLEKLNSNKREGWSLWVDGENEYPEFRTGMSECGLIGKGTPTSPYRIKSAEDLVLMSELISNDAAFADDYYRMSADIDMKDIAFDPIGKKHHFSGVFDGANHSIMNLTINDKDDNTGLFAFVENGKIHNLGIENGEITGGNKTGALIGRTMNATIINCYSKANVSGKYDVGGLVGMFNNSYMHNCYVWGNIEGFESVGGLSGSLNRSVDPSLNAMISNCYSLATATAENRYAGSAFGYDETKADIKYKIEMTNIFYENSKTGIGNDYVRDEVISLNKDAFKNGVLYTKLNDGCLEGYRSWYQGKEGYPEFTGKVMVVSTLNGSGTKEDPYIVSSAEDMVEMARMIDISKECASAYYKMSDNIDMKKVTFNGAASINAFSGVFDGAGHVITNIDIYETKENVGLFHYVEKGTIKNLGIDSGMIEGGMKVGAFAGRSMYATIKNCYNNATVKGFEDVGGLIGMDNNSSILNSYNSGDVRGSKSIGGLVGSLNRQLDEKVQPVIRNSYNIGHNFWGTYSGNIAGFADSGEMSPLYEYVYCNGSAVPDVAIGNFVEYEGIHKMSKKELKSKKLLNFLNDHLEDEYSEWKLGKDGLVRLALFDKVSSLEEFMSKIEDQLEIKNGKIVLPKSKDGKYQAILFGSNNTQVVDLDGTVYTPLVDQKVYLIYDIIDTKTKEKVAQLDRNVIIDVEGKYKDNGVNHVPNVVPGLREWHGLEGNFELKSSSRIVANGEEANKAAVQLRSYLKEINGIQLDIVSSGEKDGDIVMKYDTSLNDELKEEGYYMSIEDRIVIQAPTYVGLLYGGVSISQILYQDTNHNAIPKGFVRDYPEYGVRGGMHDVARKYFSLDYIEEMGRYMAWFKLNTLHLHINEDSGLGGEYSSSFVVESKKYPQLNTYNKGYVWSQDDYRQMQKNLKNVGIDVVSEIDTPGHATVFQLINPEIVNGSNFNLNMHYDECLALIQDVFDEFLDGEDPVFQSAVVHIGTDESANTNENMRRYINDLAQYCLNKDNVDEVYYWGNLSLYYGFNDVKPENVASQIWDSADQRVDEALASGFNVINSTSNSMYLIPGNGNGLHNGYVDMETFYDTWEGTIDFDTNRQSNPSYIANKNYYCAYDLLLGNPQILGTIYCNWNDRSWANDFDVLDLMISYIGVISEKTWYGDVDRFSSGKEFVDAFNAVGNYAANANPRRIVDTDSKVIARYNFNEIKDGLVSDSENAYHMHIDEELADRDNENGKALKLDGTSLKAPFESIGYPYTVTFDIYLDKEQADNAVLFKDDDCTFYLNYQDRGVGYEIGKYGMSFDVKIPENKWTTVSLTSVYNHGGAAITTLLIDGESYPANIISKPASISSHSTTSFLGTSEMFTGVKGMVDNLIFGNKYMQIFGPEGDFEFVGEGTKESPYLISTPNELKMFGMMINAGEYEKDYFALTKDIDMRDVKYTPAGEFSGTLDGRGYRIHNLNISSTNENVGLIGFLNGGSIKNLGIESGNIKGGMKVGALVGRTMNAKVINCYNKADVSGSNDIGGIVGMFNNSYMENCYNMGNVHATVESVGGLVGSANRSIDLSKKVLIRNCYSIGVATADKQFAGALIGYDETTAGDNYKIDLEYLYCLEDMNPVGNNTRKEVTALSKEKFTDQTLLSLLNENRKEGYAMWVESESTYPEFEVKKSVDKSKLEELVASSEPLNQDDFYATTWERFETALLKAQDILDDDKATQEEVDEAVDELSKAKASLIRVPDKSVLEALINKAESLKKEEYTKESWERLEDTLEIAKIVYDGESNEEEVKQAEVDLQGAIEELKPIQTKPTLPENTPNDTGTNTSDTSNVMLLLLLLSVSGCMMVYFKRKIRNR